MQNSTDWRALQIATRAKLAERHPDDPARWSEAHRSFNGRPMTLSPQLRALYQDGHHMVVIRKAAQVGVSEYFINLAFWGAANARGGRGNVVLYQPTQVMADAFSQARMEKAIAESPSLQSMLGKTGRRRGADRVNLRRVNDGHIYIRGTENDRQLISIDADLVLLDELDRMRDGVYERAKARLGSSTAPLLRVASTPTHPNLGIDRLFQLGDQRLWFVLCPSCGEEQTKTWTDNVDFEHALVVCRSCRAPLPPETDGRWFATRPEQGEIHSYHISKLDSHFADIPAMIEASRSTNPLVVDEFFNNDLGLPHVSEGSGISVADLDQCRGNYPALTSDYWVVIMGVDVGMRQHVVIRRFHRRNGRSVPIFIGTVPRIDDIPELVSRFGVRYVVIDAQPEIHKVYELMRRLRGKVYVAYYDRDQPGHGWKSHDREVHINRTQAFDALFESIRLGLHRLPEDARSLGGAVRDGIGEYYQHMLAQQRVVERDRRGEIVARYQNMNRPDHFAHAEAFAHAFYVVRFRDRYGPGVA